MMWWILKLSCLVEATWTSWIRSLSCCLRMSLIWVLCRLLSSWYLALWCHLWNKLCKWLLVIMSIWRRWYHLDWIRELGVLSCLVGVDLGKWCWKMGMSCWWSWVTTFPSSWGVSAKCSSWWSISEIISHQLGCCVLQDCLQCIRCR